MKKKGNANVNGAKTVEQDKSSLVIYIIVILFIVGTLIGVVLSSRNNRVPVVDDSKPGFSLNATKDFDMKKMLELEVPIMLNFGAEGDPGSEQMAPVIYELNQQLMGKALIKYVDVNENKKVAEDFPIVVIPTQFFINADGTPYKPENIKDSNLIVYGDENTGEHFLTAHEGVMPKEKILEILAGMGVDVSGVEFSESR